MAGGRPKSNFPTVAEYLDQTGLTREELQAVLSERGIVAEPFQLRPSRSIMQSWAAALGLAPQQSEAGPDPPPSSGRDGERPPTAPPEAKRAPLPGAVAALAEQRISETYNFLGGVGGMALQNPRVGTVTAAYSPDIAKAWVRAAEENEFAARVVQLMSAGGATGELVMTHLVLVGGLLYVTGRGDAFGGLYAGRFGPPPEPARRAPAASNGRAGTEAAADAVGDAAGTAA